MSSGLLSRLMAISGRVMNRHPILKKIISGGQTGADRAALDFAIAHQIAHGGWCPAGRIAEDKAIEPHYQLEETPSHYYAERTEWNVRDSHGTLIFCRIKELSGGVRLTAEFAAAHKKPWLLICRENHAEAAAQIEKFLVTHQVAILNVAGPRLSTDPAIVDFTKGALRAWWKLTHGK